MLGLKGVKHWDRLLGEAVDSPSLEVFKSRMDRRLAGLVESGTILPAAAGQTR